MSNSQRNTVLKLLQHAGPEGVPTSTFLDQRIPRFSARIEELRNAGYEIQSLRQKASSWRYYLITEPEGANTGGSQPVGANPSETPTDREDRQDGSLFDVSSYGVKPRSPYDKEWATGGK